MIQLSTIKASWNQWHYIDYNLSSPLDNLVWRKTEDHLGKWIGHEVFSSVRFILNRLRLILLSDRTGNMNLRHISMICLQRCQASRWRGTAIFLIFLLLQPAWQHQFNDQVISSRWEIFGPSATNWPVFHPQSLSVCVTRNHRTGSCELNVQFQLNKVLVKSRKITSKIIIWGQSTGKHLQITWLPGNQYLVVLLQNSMANVNWYYYRDCAVFHTLYASSWPTLIYTRQLGRQFQAIEITYHITQLCAFVFVGLRVRIWFVIFSFDQITRADHRDVRCHSFHSLMWRYILIILHKPHVRLACDFCWRWRWSTCIQVDDALKQNQVIAKNLTVKMGPWWG